jgi:abortive infection bacteriophage resistance protein
LSIPDQILKLRQDGLIIADEPSASQFRQHINYYRFGGYGLAFEQARHVLLKGATFEDIRNAYEFDRALRDLVTESLEVIELDLRTNVAYQVQRSTNLTVRTWTNAPSGVGTNQQSARAPGAEGILEYRDPAPLSKGFYRIRVQ